MKKECEDRYTRLKAISQFGYDIDWMELKKYHIGIIGVGGLGVVTAEMAVRCGLGKISLYDFDIVDIVNMNRSLYKPKHIGQLKVEAAKNMLEQINPDVEIIAHAKDIMDLDFEEEFEDQIKKMDLILNGLDNLPAREYLNVKCIKFNIPYIDAAASRSGLFGYVHVIIPQKTSCASCLKRVELGVEIEKGEPCVASLPSTMAILGSIQIQEMLKILLKFGNVIDYIMYNMLSGELRRYHTKRDENCLICGVKNEGFQTIKDFEFSHENEEDIRDLIKKLEK